MDDHETIASNENEADGNDLSGVIIDADGGAGGDDDAGQSANDDQSAAGGDEGSDEVVISIGDEPAATEEEDTTRAPEWVREVRKQNREMARVLREREAEIAKLKGGGAGPQAVVVGTKPTLESCDYDTEKFEAELEAWHTRKRESEDQAAKRAKAEDEQRAAWQAKLDAYGKAKTELKVKDFEDAEATAQEVLSVTQQGVILNGADNAAVLMYALGRNPKKAKELASISDPVKFAFAVAKLETQLKVTPRKSAPIPERTLRGSGPMSGTVDSTLDRLRTEAEKTGDYSKVHQYRQQQRLKRAA